MQIIFDDYKGNDQYLNENEWNKMCMKMRTGWFPKTKEADAATVKKCEAEFPSFAGSDEIFTWEEFNEKFPTGNYMDGWSDRLIKTAFDEYSGTNGVIGAGEWLNLCIELQTDWKPTIIKTPEE